jgi:hypothetical protein
MTTEPGQYLRRKDARRRLNCHARIECRGVMQQIRVVDFSNTGLRMDGVKGLAVGDHVEIVLTPGLSVQGTIAWSVWHKAGVRFAAALTEGDGVHKFLAEQAAAIEQARVRAIAALARQEAVKAQVNPA